MLRQISIREKKINQRTPNLIVIFNINEINIRSDGEKRIGVGGLPQRPQTQPKNRPSTSRDRIRNFHQL